MIRTMKNFSWFALCILFSLVSCNEEEPEERMIERGTLTDIDGNTYQTVKIGEQWWMAENLKVQTFHDGTPINVVADDISDSSWSELNIPSAVSINDGRFGLLYNGFVLNNASKIAPAGWHIPSDEEWKMLERTIGMSLSEADQTAWRGTQEGASLTSKYSVGWPEGGLLFGTDEFGFNALPGGCKIVNGRTNLSGNTAFWWTSSMQGDQPWYRYLDRSESRIFRHHTYANYAMSIRCVKD